MIKKVIQSQYVFLLISILLFLISNSSFASLTINDAVNVSGKQRMLTQRILKNYSMIGMGNEFSDPVTDLQKNIKEFDEALEGLFVLNVNSEVNKNLNENKKIWGPIKLIIEKKPDIKKVSDLQKELDVLLASCHKTTELIAKSSDVKPSEIINISGRQRMLSQRLASLYMLQVWGIKDPEFKNKLNEALNEFSNAQKTLLSSTLNTSEINASLAKVKKIFLWFEIMGRSKSGKYVPSIISKSADKILLEMNTVTNLYIKAV